MMKHVKFLAVFKEMIDTIALIITSNFELEELTDLNCLGSNCPK
jgi:hypothetical protein